VNLRCEVWVRRRCSFRGRSFPHAEFAGGIAGGTLLGVGCLLPAAVGFYGYSFVLNCYVH